MEKQNIYQKLSNIQNTLKAPKLNKNSFGNYKYRSCEDILEAVKPLCKENNVVLILRDNLVSLDGRFYIEAVATLYDLEVCGEQISNTAYAREEEAKKGMDASQVTGTSSSYARKYALNGLFNIDDTKDADTDEYTKKTQVLEATVSQKKEIQNLMTNLKLEKEDVEKMCGMKDLNAIDNEMADLVLDVLNKKLLMS